MSKNNQNQNAAEAAPAAVDDETVAAEVTEDTTDAAVEAEEAEVSTEAEAAPAAKPAKAAKAIKHEAKQTRETISLTLSAAVALDGALVKAGTTVQVDEDLAKALLHRGKAVLATK